MDNNSHIICFLPFSYSKHLAGLDGNFNLEVFIETFGTSVTNPFGTLGSVFSSGAGGDFFSTLLVTTIIYSVFFLYRFC